MKYLIREIIYCFIDIKHKIKSKHLVFGFRAKATPFSRFDGMNKLSHHSFFSGSLGYGSYIGANSVVTGKVGKYCSIAENVMCLTKTHPVEKFVSTAPCFYSIKKQNGFTYVNKQKFNEEPKLKNEEYSIIIGNDVYIGYGVTIVAPVIIGDGAVIAANAIVTKNVEPYTIVGGTPAKVIKKRFSDEDIEYLLKLKWWDKNLEWIKRYSNFFDSVECLKKAIENCEEK